MANDDVAKYVSCTNTISYWCVRFSKNVRNHGAKWGVGNFTRNNFARPQKRNPFGPEHRRGFLSVSHSSGHFVTLTVNVYDKMRLFNRSSMDVRQYNKRRSVGARAAPEVVGWKRVWYCGQVLPITLMHTERYVLVHILLRRRSVYLSDIITLPSWQWCRIVLV